MFQFPGCPPCKLWIHLQVSRHCPGRVPPFGYPRIVACLQLPVAFRSWPRPSSAVGALASTLCSSSLDFFVAFSPETNLLNMFLDFVSQSFGLCFEVIMPYPFNWPSMNLLFLCSCQGAFLSPSLPRPLSIPFRSGEVVGRSRLELPTSRLSGECSNRLS